MIKKENIEEKEHEWQKKMREYYKKYGYERTYEKFKPDYIQYEFLGKLLHAQTAE